MLLNTSLVFFLMSFVQYSPQASGIIPACTWEGRILQVVHSGGQHTLETEADIKHCVLNDSWLFVAQAKAEISIWDISTPTARLHSTWQAPQGEIIRLALQDDRLMVFSGRLEVLPMVMTQHGLEALSMEELSMESSATVPIPQPTPGALPVSVPVLNSDFFGEVVDVKADSLVMDKGMEHGIGKGMRFKILSQALVPTFNLETEQMEMLPSNSPRGVVEVIQVSPQRSLLALSRADRASRGDLLVPTDAPLSRQDLFLPYDRGLHRLQLRLSPFVAVQSLNVGTLARAVYDYTFSFPLRIETGMRNLGLVFGEEFAMPFQFDVIPSYDTDFFEVGLGFGYSYSAHPDKKGFTFLQKVRLGTADGMHFMMWNSFIYQNKSDDWWYWGMAGEDAKGPGEACSGWEPQTGREFAWNGIDAQLSLPMNEKVSLLINASYSQAGWLYGDVGIKTLVFGNGGAGSLFIPVSIGGGTVVDYTSSGTYLACNPSTNKTQEVKDYSATGYGGPIVSIGMDYRW